MVTKEKILTRCAEMIHAKKQTLVQALQLMEEALLTETKSTVGDKHETARARLQEEQGKLLGMLNQMLELENVLRSINAVHKSGMGGKGNLVSTSRGTFFLGLSLGRLEIDGETVFAISSESPMGAQLADRKEGDSFEFRDVKYVVYSVE